MSPRREIFLVAFALAVSVPVTFGKDNAVECRSKALPLPTYFIDPTATKLGDVEIKSQVYVAPFAILNAGKNHILVDEESDVQDNVNVDASAGPLVIGKKAILAHGATVMSNPNPKIQSSSRQSALVAYAPAPALAPHSWGSTPKLTAGSSKWMPWWEPWSGGRDQLQSPHSIRSRKRCPGPGRTRTEASAVVP